MDNMVSTLTINIYHEYDICLELIIYHMIYMVTLTYNIYYVIL